jgi:hypothetical protein
MKRSEIYRRAAEQIHESRFGCCWAISDSELYFHDRYNAAFIFDCGWKFAALFKPDLPRKFWWKEPPADREPRILALLLMAEIAKEDECQPKR